MSLEDSDIVELSEGGFGGNKIKSVQRKIIPYSQRMVMSSEPNGVEALIFWKPRDSFCV